MCLCVCVCETLCAYVCDTFCADVCVPVLGMCGSMFVYVYTDISVCMFFSENIDVFLSAVLT